MFSNKDKDKRNKGMKKYFGDVHSTRKTTRTVRQSQYLSFLSLLSSPKSQLPRRNFAALISVAGISSPFDPAIESRFAFHRRKRFASTHHPFRHRYYSRRSLIRIGFVEERQAIGKIDMGKSCGKKKKHS
ncbi:hypothetical protein AKJ16_DCAP09612 [Drosera capensis]